MQQAASFPNGTFHVALAASATDTVLVAAVAGKRIRVTSLFIYCGVSNSDITFESDDPSSDTALLGPLVLGANGKVEMQEHSRGHFETDVGEALLVSSGAGSTTIILGSYVVAPPG